MKDNVVFMRVKDSLFQITVNEMRVNRIRGKPVPELRLSAYIVQQLT